jgi:PIN domain nuclease of toxin-antitoxin system
LRVARARGGAVAAVADPGAILDTAPLLAWAGGSRADLGRSAIRVLRQAEAGRTRLVVPTICLFEVGQLEERGRIALGVPFEQWCDLLEKVPALVVMPLERAHVSEVRALPTLRDPFDRLIAGTAIALGLPLITPDSRIAESRRLRVIW